MSRPLCSYSARSAGSCPVPGCLSNPQPQEGGAEAESAQPTWAAPCPGGPPALWGRGSGLGGSRWLRALRLSNPLLPLLSLPGSGFEILQPHRRSSHRPTAPLFSPSLLINRTPSIPQPWPEILHIVCSPRPPAAKTASVQEGAAGRARACAGRGAHLPPASLQPCLSPLLRGPGCRRGGASQHSRGAAGPAFHLGVLTVACGSQFGPSRPTPQPLCTALLLRWPVRPGLRPVFPHGSARPAVGAKHALAHRPSAHAAPAAPRPALCCPLLRPASRHNYACPPLPHTLSFTRTATMSLGPGQQEAGAVG